MDAARSLTQPTPHFYVLSDLCKVPRAKGRLLQEIIDAVISAE